MAQAETNLVGDSFKLGYRHQTHWGKTIAIAFFCSEVGAGMFLVSLYYHCPGGMAMGLILAGILKPYFHLAHMGAPRKSWRAFARFDRSWVSRGALAIVGFTGFGILSLLDMALGLGLPSIVSTAVKALAVASALVVIVYQGMAMSASESLTLWASPFVPLASVCYAMTAGVLATLTLASKGGVIDAAQQADLLKAAIALLLLDIAAVAGILLYAKGKSQGGAFSVALLTKGALTGCFRNWVGLLGLAAPLALLAAASVFAPAQWILGALAWGAMLIGFFVFRLLILKAAVYEPITHNLAGSIGLPR